jgi:hypothetical protein
MCELFHWQRKAPEMVRARDELKDALTLQFNAIYGTNENNLTDWQNLCQVLELSKIPDDLFRCRQVSRIF